MSKIFSIMIIASILFAFFTNNIEAIHTSILNVAQDSFDFVIPLVLLTAFYNGILSIAKDAGVMGSLEKCLRPLLARLLPDISQDKETLSYVAGNVVANIFGLGSAATPMGLKAMEGMQKNNKNKQKASRSMVTFLVLNTAGVTLIPTTVIALRNQAGSQHVMDFIPAAIIATTCASIGGLLMDRVVNYYVR